MMNINSMSSADKEAMWQMLLEDRKGAGHFNELPRLAASREESMEPEYVIYEESELDASMEDDPPLSEEEWPSLQEPFEQEDEPEEELEVRPFKAR